ncbi:medium-chain acyl-CoA ligase ACSF2, mitochondrial-like [Protopterus annectens]|uniref:medium-chain acyl-CoA ligase ACSF2, mitochondrial-like n=1 Tax=Protopterus annectens TaxID=7888 RepID=UPI001CF98524|nr:medium-chain acyl-CoA ligase ACSF2, mitochondrial-like [Protopterus annectens]
MVSRIFHHWFARKVFLETKRNLQPDKIQLNKTYGVQQSCTFHNESPPLRPILTTSYVHGTSNIPLIGKTVGQCLEETTNKFPDREAAVFVWEGIRKTYAEFNKEVDTLAAGLLAIGLMKGDRLGVWGPNSYGWLLFQFATAKAGIILVTINPAYQSQELENALRKVGCKALVFPNEFKTQKYYELLMNVCPEVEQSSAGGINSARLPELRTVIMLDNRQPGTFHLDEVMLAGSTSYVQQLQELQKTMSFDDPINIQFTSGTSGMPKAVILTHFTMLNNAALAGFRLGYNWRVTRICLLAPMYHCFGTVLGCMTMPIFGSTIVYSSPSFDGRAALEAISKEKCTSICGTPTMFIEMLSQPDISKFDLSSLQTGIISASPVPKEIFKKVMTEMHCHELTVAYGITETSGVTFLGFPFEDLERKIETVGYILPHIQAKVVDTSTGHVAPLNTSGEIYIRGYCVMLGYWGDLEKTKEAIAPDGWYKTGDLGTMDEYGYLRIVGRCSDMIIRGGQNIYPAEIEQFLHKHPKIQEAQVVGVKDKRMGEEVCACLRLNEGQVVTTDEIKSVCKGQLSHFKIPKYVVTVNSYPMTTSGKIQKYLLKKEMEKHLGL